MSIRNPLTLTLIALALLTRTAHAQVVVAPDLVLSYIVNPSGNQTVVRNNDTLTFPTTAVGDTSTATIIVTNRGNGPGTVNSIAISGDAFKISGLPLLPATVAANNNDIRFTVTFVPTTRGAATGVLRVALGGATLTLNLQGQGVAAVLAYEAVIDSTVVPANVNGTVAFPDTPVGATKAIQFRVRNTGDAPARIGAVSVSGTGFQVTDLPPAPITIAPGQASVFTITFSPKDPGPITASLRIDQDAFNLTGTGLGSKLTFTVTIGSSTTTIAANGTLTFPNISVGTKSTADVTVSNTGNVPTVINSFSVSGAGFSLGELPAVPVQLAPGGTAHFQVTFAPDTVGAATAVLQVEDQQISLRASANPPAPLPAVTITGLTANTDALQQPAVGLTLSTPYPLDVTGKLTLSFSSQSFVDDPNIQFSTGGRSIDFRIPANTTDAIFSNGAKQVQFQTGTVAGSVTVTSSFTIGSANVTPSPAPSRTAAIAAGAPVIRSVQIGNRSNTTFELIITGYATSRSVSQINLQFTPAAGSNLTTTTLTTNVDSAFSAWYQSPSSRTFGSQFSVSVSISVSGDINAVQSVSVTAANSLGTSAPASVSLR